MVLMMVQHKDTTQYRNPTYREPSILKNRLQRKLSWIYLLVLLIYSVLSFWGCWYGGDGSVFSFLYVVLFSYVCPSSEGCALALMSSPSSLLSPSSRRSMVIEKFEALDIEKPENMETNCSAAPTSEARQGRSEKRTYPRKRVMLGWFLMVHFGVTRGKGLINQGSSSLAQN